MILRWGLDHCFYISFTPSTVVCHGFSLVTNVLNVSRFGQKRLLNALNVNVNANKRRNFLEWIMISLGLNTVRNILVFFVEIYFSSSVWRSSFFLLFTFILRQWLCVREIKWTVLFCTIALLPWLPAPAYKSPQLQSLTPQLRMTRTKLEATSPDCTPSHPAESLPSIP